MESKAEEYSDENCHVGEANQYSTEEGDESSVSSRACNKRLKHAVSESSKMPSVYSSRDSLSENAESKQTLSEKYQDSKCLEGLDESFSCNNRASKANLVSGSHQINSDRINLSRSSASVSLLGTDGSGIRTSVDMPGILSSKDAAIPNFSECCIENAGSSLTKEREPIIVSGEKSLPETAKVPLKIYPKSEADTDNDAGNAKDVDHRYSAHERLHEGEEPVKSPGVPVPQSEDESDDSDIVEQDVKVCDICGDSGREDKLAICCRCSDGAEHTYCMRVMLEKVPEGDWLCEECKDAEDAANLRLDVEGNKNRKASSSSQISGKRPSESVEIAIAAKRQALESSTGSPKAASPKKIVSLSRESSFKSLDNGKVKPGQQIPIRNHRGGDDIALGRSLSTGPRCQTARSTLLKSNSFNNFNSKPRAKFVDDVPRKQKGTGQHISKNMETPAGLISKSASFKSSNLGRATESKVKMLSSKSGTSQDLKGSRHGKESGVFDKKNMSRIDRPVTCSVATTSKGDQKLTPRGETAKPSAVNHNREFKVNQDGKLNSLTKSMNNISHKSREPQERTSTSAHETPQNGLPRSRETTNHVDKTKDGCSDRVKPSLTNTSECCTIGGTQELGNEVSVNATSSSKEEMHNGNSLKAAIHAALLKRPEIHKKKDVPERTCEFPTSGADLKCEVSYQDRVSASNTLKNSISSEETNAKQETIDNSTFETSKCLSANDVKQLHFCPTDFCSQLRKSDSVGSASGKPVVRDLLNRALEISSVISKMSAIPEYEYIWQGVFEVHRSGKPPDLYTGLQAHLSSCASPKVLDVVNKFLPEVSLHEVSRLSTWPIQFHQGGGAKEDNIALYFFAKDVESYDRYYKSLLDHMIKNDLALKGIFDGVELLIFASNQLPENSQRWNRLFFLWGIFRGKRINHSDSAKKSCIPSLNVIPNDKFFPTAVMTLSETSCSPKCMGEKSIACGKAHSALLPSTSIDQAHIMKGSVLECGQDRESKSPEATRTSVTSTIMETKTNYDIAVEQENSLSSRIPCVVNQEIGTASNVSKDEISERTNNNENQQRPKRKPIEDDLDINMEAKFQGEETETGVNCQLPHDKKVQHTDFSQTAVEASAVSGQKMPWDMINGKLEDRESFRKPQTNDFSSCSSVEVKGYKEACVEKIIHEDLGKIERSFFPSVAHNKLKGPHEHGDQFQAGIPDLELALHGGEMKPSPKGMLPFFAGAVDKKNNQEKTRDLLEDRKEDDTDGVAASLSLSLSFPSSDKEQINPVSESQRLPDGQHVNTSLLLFGKFTDK